MTPRAPREESFSARLRGSAMAARVGVWLGVCFGIAFLTGLISHGLQSGIPWLAEPTRPTWGYRVTQGLHVATGTAAVPLLLVKLWIVFPRLFARVPRPGRALVIHLLERLSILVLVSAAIFELAIGLANAAQWYPWSFSFRPTHFAVAWVAIGALVLHVAVKLPMIRDGLGSPVDDPEPHPSGGLTRRGLLRTAWLASGVAVLLTAGHSVPGLRRVSVLAVRSGEGPGGVPINRTARQAAVTAAALDPAYRLTITRGERSVTLTRDDLVALPQVEAELPIACVEGWSASGRWSGVRMRDLVALVGSGPADVEVISLQRRGAFSRTRLPANFVADDLTLLALNLEGEPLGLDHGYPARLIAPNRPGVLQTKWIARLEVSGQVST